MAKAANPTIHLLSKCSCRRPLPPPPPSPAPVPWASRIVNRQLPGQGLILPAEIGSATAAARGELAIVVETDCWHIHRRTADGGRRYHYRRGRWALRPLDVKNDPGAPASSALSASFIKYWQTRMLSLTFLNTGPTLSALNIDIETLSFMRRAYYRA